MTNKVKALRVLGNPKGKVIAVDLDGTLSKSEYWGEGIPEPIPQMIDIVNELFMKGGIIIIYTARRPEYARETYAWLDVNGVLYHGVMMQRKPGADLYIDDKGLNVDEVIHQSQQSDFYHLEQLQLFREDQERLAIETYVNDYTIPKEEDDEEEV